MHALVIEENKVAREAVAGQLQHAGHRVTMAANQAAALAILEKDSPDVILLTWSNAACDVLRRIRAQENDTHAYVIVLMNNQPVTAISVAITAGADDFLRVPMSREELVARVGMPMRFRKWASIAAAQLVDDATSERDLRKLAVFQNMGGIVGKDLSALAGPLHVAEGFLVSGDLHGASIPMSIASERAEIRVSVVVERRLVKSLAGLLLCDENPSEDAVKDMIREIANTAGGAVKRAAELEQLQLTTGLPVDEARGVTRREMTRCWTATIEGTQAQIGIIGEVNRRANQRIPLGKVQEGMVVAHDLRNEAGALIMPAGSRLTLSSVTRMVGLLGPRFVVDVMDA
jgi:CheY-like chemotaxis protein